MKLATRVLFLLMILAAVSLAATSLQSGYNVEVTVASHDSGGNAASLSNLTCDINNHAIAYCVIKDASHITVVSRGPIGNFTLTASGKNSANATITQTADFTVTAGPATAITLSPGTPQPWDITVPAMPVGW